jgi:uncharacterized phage-associated protein
MIRFNFNEAKAREAVVYVAKKWETGITPFFLAKVIFFADRDHLRKYGRPVTGDTYFAMGDGPVPSRIYDMVKGNLDLFGDPEAIDDAIRVDTNAKYRRVYAKRDPDLDLFSETDITELNAATKFCKDRSFAILSELTHQERAWREAVDNGPMNLELLVDEDQREEVRETAAYVVL